MNNDQIAEMLTAMELAWPRDRPQGWQKMWAEHVRDLPYSETVTAMTRMTRTKSFPPSIAELREAVAIEMGALPPADGDDWGILWSSAWVQSEMRHADEPTRPHAAVVAAVHVFGGPHAVDGDHEGWRRFWRARANALRVEILIGDMSTLALTS